MGLLYDAVIKMKKKKGSEAAGSRSTSPSLVKPVTQQLSRTASSRTTPLNLPGWLVK